MRCYNCSVELSNDATTCHKCGRALQEEYECECGEFLDADEVQCPECGVEVENKK